VPARAHLYAFADADALLGLHGAFDGALAPQCRGMSSDVQPNSSMRSPVSPPARFHSCAKLCRHRYESGSAVQAVFPVTEQVPSSSGRTTRSIVDGTDRIGRKRCQLMPPR